MTNQPISLAPNLVSRPYRGGKRLAAFRNTDIGAEDRVPEDWLASTTNVYNQPERGPTRLPDGRRLKDAIQSDPAVFLGPDHVAVFGPDPALLVKLLDAQQRLSVHLHPSRPFVRSHLKTRYGKSEAWYILAAEPGSVIHLGFKTEVDAAELLQVVESGTGVSLLDRMNSVSVSPGDTIFVPGGIPHAIGAGIFMVELQEPSDLLVRLEWSGYSVGAIPSDLGLGFSTALGAVDRSGWTTAKLNAITHRAGELGRLLPPAADPFFRLERAGKGEELAQGFMVLVGVRGEGAIRALGKSTAIKVGECFMVPWASGRIAIEGDVDVVCCRPGDPAAARKSDPDLLKFH